MFYDVAMNFVIGTILMVVGAIMICIPNRVFTWILVVSILFLFANGVTLFIRFFKNKKNKDFFFSILSFAFMFFLMNFRYIPQWILRVNFGGYCILCGSACFIQLVIDKINHFKGKFFNFVFTLIYILFGFYLLLNPNFHTDLLMQAFGIYFMILGLRYLGDGYVGINPLTKYKWKRKVRITLPAFLCALVPDAALASINRYLEEGKPEDLNTYKMEDPVRLKVIVHVGPKGFQKVGHICFSYDNIVYSYGNYDSDSFRLNQTIGDGIFFTVPLEKYIPNMISAENNSIFEYGILTTPKQNEFIEKEIEKIRLNGYRWYTKIEKEEKKNDAVDLLNDNVSVFENTEEFQKPVYKFIGIAFNTYIIIEMDKEMYIIDQHAAHERIMYEKVKENYYHDGSKDSQMLLLPDIITLTHKEMEIAKDNMEMFEKAGFCLEEFGENTIKLTGVPTICIDLDNKELFLETLDEINTVARTAKQEKEEKFIATVACKAAVKANMVLTKEEVESLMDQLLKLPNPFTCPHGRPTAIKMSKYEIERKFARK